MSWKKTDDEELSALARCCVLADEAVNSGNAERRHQ
jgi:hypothetical protein